MMIFSAPKLIRINVQKPDYNWIVIKINREIDLYTKTYMDIIMKDLNQPEDFIMTKEEANLRLLEYDEETRID